MKKKRKKSKEKTSKGKKVCIISKKELSKSELKTAKKVKDDHIIRTIRKLKKMLNVETNNELYVSKKHLEEYEKRRKSFEKNIVFSVIIGVIIFLGLGVMPVVTTGTINLGAIVLGLLIAVLLIFLAGILKYTPAIQR